MTDLIKRADLPIKYLTLSSRETDKDGNVIQSRSTTWEVVMKTDIDDAPSADAVDVNDVTIHYKPYPSAEAVTIQEDGTLEVKVPNAQKVGRVLVKDADSHIGGGLFYPAEAEWIPCSERLPSEDECGWYLVTVKGHELFVDVAPFNDELWKGLASHQKVIAWTPLPKPYREDGEV